MAEEIGTQQRLVLSREAIGAINDALRLVDLNTSQDLEKVHGGVQIEIVKGQIAYVKPYVSIPVQASRKRKKQLHTDNV